jgi:hypothetical protein
MVIHVLDLKLYSEFMDQVGARYGIPPDDILIVPGLYVPAKTAHGKLYFREMLDPEKALPLIRKPDICEKLLRSPRSVIEFLLLHEIFHLRNHHRDISELTVEERIANDIDADEWASREMGFDIG